MHNQHQNNKRTIATLTGTWIQLTTYPQCEYFDIEIFHKDREPVTEC